MKLPNRSPVNAATSLTSHPRPQSCAGALRMSSAQRVVPLESPVVLVNILLRKLERVAHDHHLRVVFAKSQRPVAENLHTWLHRFAGDKPSL